MFTVELKRYIGGSGEKNELTETCGQWKSFDGLCDRISMLCGSVSNFCLCVVCNDGKLKRGFGIPKDKLFNAN